MSRVERLASDEDTERSFIPSWWAKPIDTSDEDTERSFIPSWPAKPV